LSGTRWQSHKKSLPRRDNTGPLSCLVKITVFMDIHPLFQSQVWARDCFAVLPMTERFCSVTLQQDVRRAKVESLQGIIKSKVD
jgi:hypothetical protein